MSCVSFSAPVIHLFLPKNFYCQVSWLAWKSEHAQVICSYPFWGWKSRGLMAAAHPSRTSRRVVWLLLGGRKEFPRGHSAPVCGLRALPAPWPASRAQLPSSHLVPIVTQAQKSCTGGITHLYCIHDNYQGQQNVRSTES